MVKTSEQHVTKKAKQSLHYSRADGKFINTDIINYAQKHLLNCFIAHLLCASSLKILRTKHRYYSC